MKKVNEKGMRTRGAPRIDPHGVYRLGQLRDLLGLTTDALRRERREGRLRVVRVGNAYLCRGEWVIAWLDGLADSCPRPPGAVESPRPVKENGAARRA